MTIKNIFIAAGLFLCVLLVVFAFRLIQLRSSVGGHKAFWEERAKTDIPDNAFIYVALGDSTAQAIGASQPWKGYVGLVAEHIGSKANRPVHVINLSKSGAKIQDVLREQLPALGNYPKPDVVTIEIGANDILNYEEERFEREFKELLILLPSGTVVSDLPSFKGGRFNSYAGLAKSANKIIQPMIESSNHIPVNLSAATKKEGVTDLAADFFHPNDRSYKRWAGAFISGVNKKL